MYPMAPTGEKRSQCMKAPALQLCVFLGVGWESGWTRYPGGPPIGSVPWWRRVPKAQAGCPWGVVPALCLPSQDTLGPRSPESGGRGVWFSLEGMDAGGVVDDAHTELLITHVAVIHTQNKNQQQILISHLSLKVLFQIYQLCKYSRPRHTPRHSQSPCSLQEI